MLDCLNHIGDRGQAGRRSGRLSYALAGAALIAILVAVAPAAIGAAECPTKQREPHIPPVGGPVINIDRLVLNIDKLKEQLLEYKEGKDGKPGEYNDDVKRVFDDAFAYVQQRADEFKQRPNQGKKPAVVLDIDETSLSNWSNIKANNFGFIKGGPCFEEPNLACGFDDWILKASAAAIAPALDFFNAVIAKDAAVFFITGRRDRQRQATLWNLDRAGFQGWAGLSTRPDDDHNRSIVPFKSGERKKIEDSKKIDNGYTIIANVGDQQSDLEGDFAECGFKVPNPFYFIE
jgi:hypothetical protein